MVNGIIGKKLGMTQLFLEDGSVTPVTVIKAGPCIVVQKKTVNTDGYDAVQLGLVEEKAPRRINKPTEGHFKRAGVPPTRVLREVRIQASDEATSVGDKILVDMFTEDDVVEVIGKSKGKGFAGVVKRHWRRRHSRLDVSPRAWWDWSFGVSVSSHQRNKDAGSDGQRADYG